MSEAGYLRSSALVTTFPDVPPGDQPLGVILPPPDEAYDTLLFTAPRK